MDKIKYSVAKDFTRIPGPRYSRQGSFSGEQFLNDVLLDLFEKAIRQGNILEINLDHTTGFSPSFLEESFGGLAQTKTMRLISKHLLFVSEEEPFLIEEIKEYIEEASRKKELIFLA